MSEQFFILKLIEYISKFPKGNGISCSERKRLKKQYIRLNKKCFFCNIPLTKENISIDHLTPKSCSGTDRKQNRVAACYKCNHRKDNKLIHELPGFMLH